tara:strand:- start:795 stop:1385 length:591 start_codon:yes stop_codon:yes gene_type:complete
LNFFSKFFKKKSSESEKEKSYLPKKKAVIEERFILKFIENGGKFLYCENLDEVKENFDLILSENDWSEKDVLLIKDNLKKKYGIDKSFSNNAKNAKCFLTNCENLIASDGSILISSNQIHEKKLLDLPNNLIILSHTKKLRNNISEGLAEIKSRGDIPTNITTIKNFNLEEKSNDFLSYGTASKNLYLIMLEKGVN